MPGVGPSYCVALPANDAWGREMTGNTVKACADSWQMASQQWLGAFSRARADSRGEEQHASSSASGMMLSYPMTQGTLAADPCPLASSAKAGGRVQLPPCWVVGDEWPHVV